MNELLSAVKFEQECYPFISKRHFGKNQNALNDGLLEGWGVLVETKVFLSQHVTGPT